MLTLNYALGYADKADKTVGPPFFYWYVALSQRLGQ